MNELGDMTEGGFRSANKNPDYQAEPIQRGKSSPPDQKKDPYVVRATERAKKKIRDRFLELNEGRLN